MECIQTTMASCCPQAEIDALRSVDWDEEVEAARDPTVKVSALWACGASPAKAGRWRAACMDRRACVRRAGRVSHGPRHAGCQPPHPLTCGLNCSPRARLCPAPSPACPQYPSYYTQPFHAYPEGNLAMEPALEMTVAARRHGGSLLACSGVGCADCCGMAWARHALRARFNAQQQACCRLAALTHKAPALLCLTAACTAWCTTLRERPLIRRWAGGTGGCLCIPNCVDTKLFQAGQIAGMVAAALCPHGAATRIKAWQLRCSCPWVG